MTTESHPAILAEHENTSGGFDLPDTPGFDLLDNTAEEQSLVSVSPVGAAARELAHQAAQDAIQFQLREQDQIRNLQTELEQRREESERLQAEINLLREASEGIEKERDDALKRANQMNLVNLMHIDSAISRDKRGQEHVPVLVESSSQVGDSYILSHQRTVIAFYYVIARQPMSFFQTLKI
eukprot:sb/3471606/